MIAQTAKATEQIVADLYREVDVPPPSLRWLIAPLGPLLQRLPVVCKELPGLTRDVVQKYLLECGGLTEPRPFGTPEEQHLPVAGFAVQCDDLAYLWVNADEPIVRRRFSMAHELGHYIRHFRPRMRLRLEAPGDADTILSWDAFTPTDLKNAEARSPSDYEREESEADAFASALLMPRALVRARKAELAPEFANDAAGLSDRLAMEFLVSRDAMRRTLADLGVPDGDNHL